MARANFSPIGVPTGGGIGLAAHYDGNPSTDHDNDGYFDDVADQVALMGSPFILSYGGGTGTNHVIVMVEKTDNASNPVRKVARSTITFT